MKTIPFKNKAGKPFYKFEMSSAEFSTLDTEYSGLCVKCGAVRDGDTEPDARRYPCENCGENGAYGASELLLMGLILID